MHILNFLVILHLLVTVEIEADRRIFDGKEVATTKDVPFIVRLIVFKGKMVGDKVRISHCAGSYIQPKWVISATRCIKSHFPLVDNKPKFRVDLCMGSVDTWKCDRKNRRYADRLFPYTEGAAFPEHDVLLIHIKRPWVIGPTINFAKLPTTKVNKASLINKDCLIAGWGTMDVKDHLTDILKIALAKIIKPDPKMCKTRKTEVCAEFLTAITCQGDSGGPLLYDNTLIGVLHGGPPGSPHCGITGKHSVFQLIQEHQDWITNVTNNYMNAGTRIIVPNNLSLFIFCYTLLFSIISIF